MNNRQLDKDFYIKKLINDPDGFKWALYKGDLEINQFDYFSEAKNHYKDYYKEGKQ